MNKDILKVDKQVDQFEQNKNKVQANSAQITPYCSFK